MENMIYLNVSLLGFHRYDGLSHLSTGIRLSCELLRAARGWPFASCNSHNGSGGEGRSNLHVREVGDEV